MAKTNGQYEGMFLFAAGTEMDSATKIVRTSIERHGGEILLLKKWDERKLVYEIGKHKRGLYIIAYFKAPGASVGPIERDAKLSEDVVRLLITAADHLSLKEMEAVEPQPIVKVEDRAPWDRPGFNVDERGSRGPRGPRSDAPEAAGMNKD